VAAQGAVTEACLGAFQAVLWMTGNEAQNTLTADDRTALAAYLESGGELLLTGQNLVEDVGGTGFFADYLKAAPLAGDVNDFALEGVEGDPISDSLWVMIIGAGAGNNQTSPGSVSALPGAVEIFFYRNEPQHRPGAIRYDGGIFKTLTFAFGLEAVSGLAGSNYLPQVLKPALNWLGLATAVPPAAKPSVPGAFALHPAYPNPFNPSTVIRYELRAASRVSLRVYDTAGREVRTLVEGWRAAGNHEVTFEGADLPSGVYLLRLETSGLRQPRLREVRKLILLK
jgi:hypothetical protein